MGSDDSLAKTETREILSAANHSPLALLGEAVRENSDRADNAVADIVKSIKRQAPEAVQLHQANQKGFRLVVDASDDMLQAIDRGDIKLTTDKLGNTYAQIKQTSGEFGKKLPIKKEEFSQGIDPIQAANAMQMKALQEQLDEISGQITVIDGRVKEVLRGQQNDRIGLFNSGMALYLEAREISDENLRKLLTAQSLRALSDAAAQLDLELQENVSYLANGEYESQGSHPLLMRNPRLTVASPFFTRLILPAPQYIANKARLRLWPPHSNPTPTSLIRLSARTQVCLPSSTPRITAPRKASGGREPPYNLMCLHSAKPFQSPKKPSTLKP